MKTTILQSVGETLKHLLHTKMPNVLTEDAIHLTSPIEIPEELGNRLSIFLYQIQENTYLRNAPRQIVSKNRIEAPPLVVDLHYLFTPFAPSQSAEFLILEKLMQIFYDHSAFTEDILQGNLQETGNTRNTIANNPLTREGLRDIWGLFPPGNFKLSLSYIVSSVQIPSTRSKEFVQTKEVAVGTDFKE